MKIVLSAFLIFFCVVSYSQNGDNLHKQDRDRVILTANSEIKGNDFIYDEWNRGMIVLNDSVFSKQDYLKYDAYKKRIFIKSMKNPSEIIELADASLTAFSILEGKTNLKHDFVKLKRSDFKDDGENGFYEILFNLENTNYVIKKNNKILFDPNRSKGSQTINNFPLEYKDENSYYIKDDEGSYVMVRLKKRDIKAVLTKNSKMLNSYIKSKKLKYHKEADVVKLVNYYYSL